MKLIVQVTGMNVFPKILGNLGLFNNCNFYGRGWLVFSENTDKADSAPYVIG